MKKVTFYLLALILIINKGFSQDIINNNLLNQATNQQLIEGTKSNLENVKGSPYINTNFLSATVDKLPGKNLSARYNAYNDEVEIKRGNDNNKYFLSKKSKFSKVKFLSSKTILEAHDYIENGKNKRGYLSQLTLYGKTVLLKKQSIVFVEAKASKTGYDQGTPPQFKKEKDKYFIKIKDATIVELQKSKKDLAKLFPKHEREILNYIKKQGLNTKKEDDLITLFNYINTLN